jgi:hypothetical protein
LFYFVPGGIRELRFAFLWKKHEENGSQCVGSDFHRKESGLNEAIDAREYSIEIAIIVKGGHLYVDNRPIDEIRQPLLFIAVDHAQQHFTVQRFPRTVGKLKKDAAVCHRLRC